MTLTLNVHVCAPDRVAPASVIEPAARVMMPASQLPVADVPEVTVRPAGNVSTKPRPVSVAKLGFTIVKVSLAAPPARTLDHVQSRPHNIGMYVQPGRSFHFLC